MLTGEGGCLWAGCFVVSIVPAVILASIVIRRRRRNRRSAMDMALWGLLIPLALYPLGCQTFLITSLVHETVEARLAKALLARLYKGMTPAQVEAVMGRPPEKTDPHGLYHDPANYYFQEWTVEGNRVEVSFAEGRVDDWWSWPPDHEDDDYDGFFQRLFLWGMPDLD